MGRHFLGVPWKTPVVDRGPLWWCLITRRENLGSEARRRPWLLLKPSFLLERKFFPSVGARRACSCLPHCGNRAGICRKIPHPAQAGAGAGRGPVPEQGFEPETRAGLAPASLTFCGQVRPSLSLGSLEDEMGATGQQLRVGSGPTCSRAPWGPWVGRSHESLSPGASPGKPPLATVGWAWEQLAGGEGGALHPAGVPSRNGRDLPQAQTPHRLRGARPASLLRPTGAPGRVCLAALVGPSPAPAPSRSSCVKWSW